MAGVVLFLYLADLALHVAWPRCRAWTKLLLVPLLIIYIWLQAPQADWLLVLALFAGWGGDFSLVHKSSRAWFMAGLASFLIGHLVYTAFFLKSADFSWAASPLLLLLVLPYIAAALPVYRRIGPRLGSMKPAVIVYSTALCAMSLAALLRLTRFSGFSFWLPLLGSLLFVYSDANLALDHFGIRIRYRHAKVMLAYGLAQLLIVTGIVGTAG